MSSDYSFNNKLLGLGTIERNQLTKLLRETKITISISEAVETLELSRNQAAKLLAKLATKGWLERIGPGIYIPIELESLSNELVAEEPFAIAEKIFSPCYISGLNAANHWDLTEQIFNTVTVMTQKQVRDRSPLIAGNQYAVHTIHPKYFFGMKAVWLSNIKINIADPTRTIVDMLAFPQFCGGMRFIKEIIQNYSQSEHKNIEKLIRYLEQASNGAAIKRMGFLTDMLFPDEIELINYCTNNLSQGYVKLSPSLTCSKLVSKWRIWIPENWKEN